MAIPKDWKGRWPDVFQIVGRQKKEDVLTKRVGVASPLALLGVLIACSSESDTIPDSNPVTSTESPINPTQTE